MHCESAATQFGTSHPAPNPLLRRGPKVGPVMLDVGVAVNTMSMLTRGRRGRNFVGLVKETKAHLRVHIDGCRTGRRRFQKLFEPHVDLQKVWKNPRFRASRTAPVAGDVPRCMRTASSASWPFFRNVLKSKHVRGWLHNVERHRIWILFIESWSMRLTV